MMHSGANMFWYKWNSETKKREFTCKEAEEEYKAYKAKQPKVSLAEFIKNPNIFKDKR